MYYKSYAEWPLDGALYRARLSTSAIDHIAVPGHFPGTSSDNLTEDDIKAVALGICGAYFQVLEVLLQQNPDFASEFERQLAGSKQLDPAATQARFSYEYSLLRDVAEAMEPALRDLEDLGDLLEMRTRATRALVFFYGGTHRVDELVEYFRSTKDPLVQVVILRALADAKNRDSLLRIAAQEMAETSHSPAVRTAARDYLAQPSNPPRDP